MSDNESNLAARAIAGDADALTQLLHEHGPGIRALIAGSIASKWQTVLDADDVMQVTYLEAFLSIDGFVHQGQGSFTGWLKRIANNNLRDAVRELERQKRPQPENRIHPNSDDDSATSFMAELGYTTTTASQHATRDEIRSAIETAILGLPEDYSQVVRLYDIEGQPASHVATALNRSVGAIYMLRARAHDRLRESFGNGTQFFTHRPR